MDYLDLLENSTGDYFEDYFISGRNDSNEHDSKR